MLVLLHAILLHGKVCITSNIMLVLLKLVLNVNTLHVV